MCVSLKEKNSLNQTKVNQINHVIFPNLCWKILRWAQALFSGVRAWALAPKGGGFHYWLRAGTWVANLKVWFTSLSLSLFSPLLFPLPPFHSKKDYRKNWKYWDGIPGDWSLQDKIQGPEAFSGLSTHARSKQHYRALRPEASRRPLYPTAPTLWSGGRCVVISRATAAAAAQRALGFGLALGGIVLKWRWESPSFTGGSRSGTPASAKW